jgi:hypothetical protein
MVMVTGAGPQSKVISPPAATAATTAADVQLAGVPLPTTRSGLRVSTARASAGTAAFPPGLPGLGSERGRCDGLGPGFVAAAEAGVEGTGVVAAGGTAAGATNDGDEGGGVSVPQAASAKAQVTATAAAGRERTARC